MQSQPDLQHNTRQDQGGAHASPPLKTLRSTHVRQSWQAMTGVGRCQNKCRRHASRQTQALGEQLGYRELHEGYRGNGGEGQLHLEAGGASHTLRQMGKHGPLAPPLYKLRLTHGRVAAAEPRGANTTVATQVALDTQPIMLDEGGDFCNKRSHDPGRGERGSTSVSEGTSLTSQPYPLEHGHPQKSPELLQPLRIGGGPPRKSIISQ
jgi:hypothetical protein